MPRGGGGIRLGKSKGKSKGKAKAGSGDVMPPAVKAAAGRLARGQASSADQKILAEWRNRNKVKRSPGEVRARRSHHRAMRLGPKVLRSRRIAHEDTVLAGKTYRAGDKIPDAAFAKGSPAQRAAIDNHTRGKLIASGDMPTGAVGLRKTAEGVVPHFGISGARTVVYDPAAQSHARAIFGRDVHESELATLAGAGDKASVWIRGSPHSRTVTITVHGDGYESTRLVLPGTNGGPPVLVNASLVTQRSGSGAGLGIFGRQVEQAQRMGVSKIRTFAARKKGVYNGYYTWARFGYDAPLSRSSIKRLPAEAAGSRRLSDLMKTQEGRDWWKAKGRSKTMEFDLQEGSTSLKVWNGYFAQRIRKSE